MSSCFPVENVPVEMHGPLTRFHKESPVPGYSGLNLSRHLEFWWRENERMELASNGTRSSLDGPFHGSFQKFLVNGKRPKSTQWTPRICKSSSKQVKGRSPEKSNFCACMLYLTRFSFSQESRVGKMDHFFASVASLMSRNVRSAVYNSITDLVQFLGMYKHGNDFTGPFERSLPVLPQPIVLTVVRITLSIASKQVLLERPRRRRRFTPERRTKWVARAGSFAAAHSRMRFYAWDFEMESSFITPTPG